jgi:hypothetical protein
MEKIMDLMIQIGISKEAGSVVVTNLETEEEQKEMIEFLEKNPTATNTQTIMELDRILKKHKK